MPGPKWRHVLASDRVGYSTAWNVERMYLEQGYNYLIEQVCNYHEYLN